MPRVRVRLSLPAPRGLLPGAQHGLRRLRRGGQDPRAGRGVFELTGFEDIDLLGQDVAEALTLSDPAPIAVVREWGVRKLDQKIEIRTKAGREKAVTADFFPAYDDDGGMLLALTPR